MTQEPPTVRLDKWLWAARFFKTRNLAQDAIEAGHVQLNGARAKSSRDVRAGDRLELRAGNQKWLLTVRAVSTRRGPAPVAQALYEEDACGREARLLQIEAAHQAADPGAVLRGRPTKRDRRMIHRFTDS
ncbi:MAG: RNA-binding S4 domain-containing protein [Betaproteobacteria bacterium]|nr:RNA-binding S4 domain-containing protein [Betaproteobacteria bacterium]